ncbi:hypothetical protein L1987_03071 [Smallanthus sonchifolius]|uniref:Uncharacterized protein n=1 Tax=Smallanthus sonchifolius TaxID=185202 RepID=A0ACB9K9K9_9ASTR|nr:hypothetical protein L1987_03071 [Smallanthus sonchifolius]
MTRQINENGSHKHSRMHKKICQHNLFTVKIIMIGDMKPVPWLKNVKIRAGKPTKPDNNKVNPTKKQLTDNCNQKPPQSYGTSYIKNRDQESPSRRHFSSRQYCHAAYPTVQSF